MKKQFKKNQGILFFYILLVSVSYLMSVNAEKINKQTQENIKEISVYAYNEKK